MKQIILTHVGYTINGTATVLDWNDNFVETPLHDFFIENADFDEDLIPISKGLHVRYKAIESAEVFIYKNYQGSVDNQVTSALVYSKTKSI